MKLHHTQYKKNYVKYILDQSELTPAELRERFVSEYGHNIERMGEHKACAEWLQGIALDIPIYCHDVIKLAIEMGATDENPTKRTEQALIDNYWSFMADRTLEAMRIK